MQIIPLPYQKNMAQSFHHIANHHWAVFLDSSEHHSALQRYSIITAEPLYTMLYEAGEASIFQNDKPVASHQTPYQALHHLQSLLPENGSLPFFGGIVGFLSYNLGNNHFKPENKGGRILPLAAAGLYQWCLLTDHKEKTSTLLSWDQHYDLKQWKKRLTQARQTTHTKIQPHSQNPPNFSDYQRAFNKIKRYLYEGDCYQVNFAHRFVSHTPASSWQIYQHLRTSNPVPFAAYLHYPFADILSFSPECFLDVEQDQVATYPIKGTTPRHPDSQTDRSVSAQLRASPKNRAENLMIVDLMRNDLSQVCCKGSIQVPELFALKSFRYVHHLQSKIIGKLQQGHSSISLLQACFPGGSITGAPKKRAMEIIDELESNNREIYCGSIFYMTKQKMLSNIAIRTAIYKDQQLYYWAGGGIVHDSEAHNEFQETLDKARVFSNL